MNGCRPIAAPKSDLPAVPRSIDELLIASLRHANAVSVRLNEIDWALTEALGDRVNDDVYDKVFALLQRRFLEDSAWHLFIAARNLGITLPDDISP